MSSSFADSVNITHYITYAIAPSVIILTLLAFLQNRRQPNKCGYHKPSLVVPMRFLDGYEDRWAYALSFGAITGVLISVFMNSFISSSGEVSSDSTNMFCGQSNSTLCREIWAKTLLLQAQALVASLVCAPHFACITTSHRLVGAVCGLLYSTFWLVVYMQGVVASIRAMSDKTVGALMLLRDLPIIPCFIGLALRSVWAAYMCYKTRTLVVESEEPLVVDHQVKHVKALFAPLSKDVQHPTTLLEKLKRKVRSQLYPFFKLPTRIVSIAFVQLIVIYYAALTLTPIGVETRRLVIFFLSENTSERNTIIAIFEGVWITASLIGVISSVIYVILFVINYRHNVIYIYKGMKSSLMEGSSTAHKLMAQSLRLPGYQIAYIVWGLVVMFGAVAVIGAILAFGIFFLAKLNLLTSVLQSLAQTLSVPAITIGLFYLQVLFVRMFLMQPKLHPEDKGHLSTSTTETATTTRY
ncbi:stimulated by retinoic acid gene 6 protein-like [Pomacea canaliculata]|uniref:stimulated by retinoic acid gene 6 protein-like n=1 Tax=Pomacea canaliculata TaxID=400727 RepID=UPI000D72FB6D|nr:stimulated by retinoic acid gene 6 protein-like [Pomacea canaliculata]